MIRPRLALRRPVGLRDGECVRHVRGAVAKDGLGGSLAVDLRAQVGDSPEGPHSDAPQLVVMHVSPVGKVSLSARSTERLPEHATCQLCRDAEWLRLGWRASGGRFPPNADPRRKGSLWWGLRTEWGIPPQSLAPGALDTQAPVVVSSRNRLARSGALPRGRAPAAHPRCLAVRPSCFAAHPVRALTRATNGTRAPLDLATRRAPHATRLIRGDSRTLHK